MNTDWATIICACLASGGLFTILELVIKRKFEKNDNKDEEKKALSELESMAKTSALNDSKTLLLILINHFPQDHHAILMEAEHYFCDLHGNSWMYNLVSEWAKKEKVDISYLTAEHEQNTEQPSLD